MYKFIIRLIIFIILVSSLIRLMLFDEQKYISLLTNLVYLFSIMWITRLIRNMNIILGVCLIE